MASGRGLARELEELRERAAARAKAAMELGEETVELRREIAALRERATRLAIDAEPPDRSDEARSEDPDRPPDLAPTRGLLRRWRARG